jgi:hypothetical protein
MTHERFEPGPVRRILTGSYCGEAHPLGVLAYFSAEQPEPTPCASPPLSCLPPGIFGPIGDRGLVGKEVAHARSALRKRASPQPSRAPRVVEQHSHHSGAAPFWFMAGPLDLGVHCQAGPLSMSDGRYRKKQSSAILSSDSPW